MTLSTALRPLGRDSSIPGALACEMRVVGLVRLLVRRRLSGCRSLGLDVEGVSSGREGRRLLLREPWGGCASPSDRSYWKNKGLFTGADRLCFWRQSHHDIIVAVIGFSCNSARSPALPPRPCGSFLLTCPQSLWTRKSAGFLVF